MQEKLDLSYYNSTNYPLSVKGQLSALTYTKEDETLLKYHQFIVAEFFTRNLHQRGLLVCHGMGMGKTRLAVSICEHSRIYDKHRRIILLSAKSLEGNFRKEVVSYAGISDEEITKNYKFISLNSSNMFKQVANVDKSDEELKLEKKLGNFLDDVVRDSSLENSLLIVDEAHNLFNSITNGATNALKLYDLIMETKNVKLIFMSGTPIINDPFELVPCFNMLRGFIKINTYKGGDDTDNSLSESVNDDDSDKDTESIDENTKVESIDEETSDQRELEVDTNTKVESIGKNNFADRREKAKAKFKSKFNSKFKKDKTFDKKANTVLFSEDIDEFRSYFVDAEKAVIKNEDKFANRIFGLVSYYGDLYFPSEKDKPGFPKELPNIIEKVPMSNFQYARYLSARELEQEETSRGYKASGSRFSSSTGGSSTYRVKSRQISNYCIPETALGPARGSKSREKFINKITHDELLDLKQYSPKMLTALTNIEKFVNGEKGIVYSQFVSGEGIGIFALVLKAHNYKQYNLNADLTDYLADGEQVEGGSNQKTFAILSGSIDPEERTKIIEEFNNSNTINLLLLSGAVAEGIDLKRVRHVHILEPFWNYARINQVKTRAIRYNSHIDLPLDQQNVQVYIYLSDYPKDLPKEKQREPTTDLDMYKKSITNMHLINTFLLALAKASIDCSMHHDKLDPETQKKITCKLCSPTNEMLFHPVLGTDMLLPSNCKPFQESEVSVEEIVLPGIAEKFYFKRDTDVNNIKLYHFNKRLNRYAPVLRDHPLFADVMNAVVLKI